MTQYYKIRVKAEDLKIGDRLVSWWTGPGNVPVEYMHGRMITNITYRRAPYLGQINVHLDDGRRPLPLHSEHVVMIEVIA